MKWRLDDGQIEIVDDAVAAILKKKTPAERLKIAFSMWHSARVRLLAYVRSLHPEWSNDAIQKEIARRLSHGAA